MKRVVLYILTLVVCNIISARQITNNDGLDSKEAFAMQSKSAIKTIAVNQSFSKEAALDLFGGVNTAYGMAVTMNVERLSDDFLVRILLEDVEGKKHLVAESYREIASDERNLCYSDYCEETSLLDGVKPVRLHIYTHDAIILLESVAISTEGTLPTKDRAAFQTATANIRKQQVQSKIERINAYNEAHHKLWRAGETSLSLMDYETKKVVMGTHDGSNLHGLEYYKGGIFEFGDAPETGSQGNAKKNMAKAPATNYNVPVTEFDWRNRHGHNWMTDVRDQDTTKYCVPFAVAGCVEAMRNLYFYTPTDTTHLSVQQLACCSFVNVNPSVHIGISPYAALPYCMQTGVMRETDYPFDAGALQECHSGEISPTDITKITGYSSVSTTSNETIRRKLIEKGPLLALINTGTGLFGHAMVLSGFKVISSGMEVVEFFKHEFPELYPWPLEPSDSLVGKTCWIFKNSWGLNYGQNGYMYAFIHDNSMLDLFSLTCPITTLHLSESDRGYSDNDGDGFYFWGGDETTDKPTSMPQWVPSFKDADDTDPTVGKLHDSNMEMEDIVPDHHPVSEITESMISSNSFSNHQYIHYHIIIKNGAVLQVDNRLNFYNGATLKVCNGATLIVKAGGLLNNVILDIESGAYIRIEGGGQIKLAQGHSFSPPIGAEIDIINGSIEPYN